MKLKINSLFLAATIVCTFSSMLIKAQAVSDFSIDHPKGCAPLTIAVQDLSSVSTSAVSYQFEKTATFAGEGFNPGVSHGTTTHTYLTAGEYFINQLVTDISEPSTNGTFPTKNVSVITAVKPTFTVKLCSSKQVAVTITDNTYDIYTINYGDGTTESALSNETKTHPYLTLGSKAIFITGKFASGNDCGVASQSITQNITPIDNLATPDITHLEVTAEGLVTGKFEVGFNKDPNVKSYVYQLMSNGTYDASGFNSLNPTAPVVPNVPHISTATAGLLKIEQVNTLNEIQCLRIVAIEACGSNVKNEICTIRTFDVQAQNLQNELTWSSYDAAALPSAPTYDVIKNGIPAGGPLGTGADTSPRPDNNVVCATNYCYRIYTNLPMSSSAGPVYSLSANKCVTAISTAVPPAVTNVNSSINGSNTQVVFDAPPSGIVVKKYYIFESSGNTATTGTANNVSFAGNPGTCYKVAYDDNCNNRSIESPFTCTVNLSGTLADDGSIALSWSPYSGYLSTGIASYDVLFLNQNGQVIKTIPAGLGLSASDVLDANAGSLYYKIRVNAGGTENLISYSNLIEISLAPTIFIPNAFTPNGDGANDIFIAKSRFVKSLEMTVFNRWGEPVFKTTDINTGWDGKVNGADAPVGSYAYTITLQGNKGESSTERGTISLIR